jgi:hypothetical protein
MSYSITYAYKFIDYYYIILLFIYLFSLYFFVFPNFKHVRVTVILRLAVYRQSVRPDIKPFEAHDQSYFFAAEPLRS